MCVWCNTCVQKMIAEKLSDVHSVINIPIPEPLNTAVDGVMLFSLFRGFLCGDSLSDRFVCCSFSCGVTF